ncbi:MAG: flagellar basal body rod C-terminal domain-containing protein, partial [Vulcanimicrobiaceae bacterium]
MDGIEWTASAMRTARLRLEIASQNLANASTDGFRRAVARVTLTPNGLATRRASSAEQGALRHTGRALDLAIVGEGAFVAGGRPTRNGAFVRDAHGYLADDRGARVQGTRGFIRVALDGKLLDRIPLPYRSQIVSGALESPNVNAIGEMVDVLDAQRAFETAQKALS